jgi:isopentenyl diphosphate isomerase/L-lactate dehydrogenase-like FMN-dependent dehydrogenase
MNGQQGVEDVIRTYLADLDLAMALSGHSSIKELHGLARDDKLEEEFFIKE